MSAIQLCLDAYAAFNISFVIIGLASTIYLLKLSEERPASRFIALGVAGFTVGTGLIFVKRVVLWGAALAPLADGFAVLSMAAVLGFAYHYPQRERTIEAWVVFVYASTITLIALGFSAYYAYQIAFNHRFELHIPGGFWWLNPITFLSALLVLARRTYQFQQWKSPDVGLRKMLAAILNSNDRQVCLLRNYTLALLIGLIQGIIYIPPFNALISTELAAGIGHISLLLMIVAVVYGSFELTTKQPSLIVRLVGLSLVGISAILGFLSIFIVSAEIAQVDEYNFQIVDFMRQAVHEMDYSSIPADIAYVVAWPVSALQESRGKLEEAELLYTAQSGLNLQSLIEEQRKRNLGLLPVPVWRHFIEYQLGKVDGDVGIALRYGNHTYASYYQYAGYIFLEGDMAYELGFDLMDLSSVPQHTSFIMVLAVVAGSLGVVTIYPLLFRSSIIRPLDRLLAGVRQLDEGDLEVVVPTLYNDEIGFLTTSFNKMSATLREELLRRRRAEEDLLKITSTLEQRIIARTRDLSVLYDISAVASREIDVRSILIESLSKTMDTFGCEMGMIFLQDEQGDDPSPIHLSVQKGFSAVWIQGLDALTLPGGLLYEVMSRDIPLLIRDISSDDRLPTSLRASGMMSLLLVPLTAARLELGVLVLFGGPDTSFDLDEVALAASIADQIGVAVHSDRLRQTIQNTNILEERQRLARDLHDSITQSLYGVATLTGAGQVRLERGDHDAISQTFERIGQTARQAIREMRLFIHQLRPSTLETEGLVSALNLRLAAVEGRSDVSARLIAEDEFELSAQTETALFYIAQEALNNSLKHAHANNVEVKFYREDHGTIFEIVDDGCGFKPDLEESGGMGISNMQKRAEEISAELEIVAHPGNGTLIRITLDEGSV